MRGASTQTEPVSAPAGERICEALWLARDLTLSVGEHRVSAPAAGAVRVAVRWAGVCGSDLHVMRTGDRVSVWPAVLGHEVYGDIDAVGPGVRMAVGTPVVLDSRLPCLDCDACRQDPDRCTRPRRLGEAMPGGFAGYVVVPAWLAHPVPEDLDGSVAVLAEPLAVAMHALAQLREAPRRAAIVGHGPIGALIHLELRRSDCPVDVAEPAPIRGALADGYGAVVVERSELLEESAYDVVVDAAGTPGSLVDAVRAAAVGATVLVVALDEHPVEVVPMALAAKRLTITGVSAFVDELPAAIARLAEEPRRYRGVVTDSVSLARLPDRLGRLAAAPDAVKLLVHP